VATTPPGMTTGGGVPWPRPDGSITRLVLVSALLALPCLAQDLRPALEHDAQSWTLLTAWGRKERFRWYAEAQPRVSLTQGRFDRLLLRPAIGVQVSPDVSLWAGYAWTPLFNPGFRDEQRPFQQVLIEQRFGVVSLVNRARVEERFIANTSGPSFRLRHMVRAVVRFSADSPWGVAAYDELFVTVNSVVGGPQAGLDQNRAFLGVNYRFSPQWQLEGGYLNNFVFRPAPLAERMNHNVTVMVVFIAPE